MKIRLRFFSALRDRFGCGERELDLAESRTAREVFLTLFEDPAEGEKLLRFTRSAVNCEYVPPETWVKEGDELAFIPPVSGG